VAPLQKVADLLASTGHAVLIQVSSTLNTSDEEVAATARYEDSPDLPDDQMTLMVA
jgi:hypothetical protein